MTAPVTRLDGPTLAAWIRAEWPRDYETAGARPSFERALRRWEGGQNPYLYSVDFHLTGIGLHINMIPDDLFLEGALA